MFQEPEVLPPPGAAGSALAPPQLQRSLTVSARASTCAEIRVARVDLQAGWTLIGVAALSVGADAPRFYRFGVSTDMHSHLQGKGEDDGCLQLFPGIEASGNLCSLLSEWVPFLIHMKMSDG